eukprot:GHVP01029466.1.p1 GENE.GHVP01029466.1~~GHVP01029466.1.p1  ORF type:complete len:133 (+),score=20.75 GHVP01029466.1:1469-1867(+)
MDVTCDDTFIDPTFDGIFGSSFLVSCPPCKDSPGKIEGSNPYSSSSNICLAGIHSGSIDVFGGTMVVSLQESQNELEGNEGHYNVQSSSSLRNIVSFLLRSYNEANSEEPTECKTDCGKCPKIQTSFSMRLH